MNIIHLQSALKSMELALQATFDAKGRSTINRLIKSLLRLLRGQGVFIGRK